MREKYVFLTQRITQLAIVMTDNRPKQSYEDNTKMHPAEAEASQCHCQKLC